MQQRHLHILPLCIDFCLGVKYHLPIKHTDTSIHRGRNGIRARLQSLWNQLKRIYKRFGSYIFYIYILYNTFLVNLQYV